MNQYYLEKMMEIEQKKRDIVTQEFWGTASPRKENKSSFVHLITSLIKNKKSINQQKQVCCS